jgi:multisubunit Na+/H+ antiporter MnhB subunit
VVIGGLIGLVPMWVHLALAGPAAAFEGMFIDPVFRLRAGRELPRPPHWNEIDGALQRTAEGTPPWWRLPHLAVSHALFLWFCVMVVGTLAFLAFAIWQRRRPERRTRRSAVLLAVALISLGILPQALQRPDSAHLLWVTCVSWPFAVVLVADMVRYWRPRIDWRGAVGIGVGFATALTFTVTALFTFRYYLLHTRVGLGQVPSAFRVERDGRYFYIGDYRASQALAGAIADLDAKAKPGERLLVGPLDLRRTWYNEAFLYWFFPELDPATYFIEMDPGVANAEGSRLADDVASADWLLLSGLWDGWREPNASVDYGSDAPNQVIRDHFCQVGSWEDDLTVLYRRCR